MFKEIVYFSKEIFQNEDFIDEIILQDTKKDTKNKKFDIIKVSFNKDCTKYNIEKIENDNEQKKLIKLYFKYGIPFGEDNNKSLGGSQGLYTSSFLCFGYGWTLSKKNIDSLNEEKKKILKEKLSENQRNAKLNDLKNKYFNDFIREILKKWEMVYEDKKFEEIYENNIPEEIKCFINKSKDKNFVKRLLEDILKKATIDKSFIVMFWFDYLDEKKIENLYMLTYDKYKSIKAFVNKKEVYKGKCQVCLKDDTKIGLPTIFNTLSNKKPFILHLDRLKKENILTCVECSDYIYKFKRFFLDKLKVRLFPLFIDPDLRTKEIKLLTKFKDEDGISFKGFKEILKTINQDYKNELSFYLVIYNYESNILFFDYITGYKYYLTEKVQQEPFIHTKDGEETFFILSDIFDIEEKLNYLLDEQLTKNYFEIEIKNKNVNPSLINLIYKNMIGIFNLIYRNNKNEFSLVNLEEIFISQMKQKLITEKDFRIKEYINNFIVCYKGLKDNFYKDQGGLNMDKLREVKENLHSIIDIKDSESLKSKLEEFFKDKDQETVDYFYGLLLGQIVYYILSQSKAKDKTHSLVEGFTNVGNLGVLSARIREYFDKYKHQIPFNFWQFNQVMSIVLEYCLENKNKSFREIEIPFYIGYFDSNIFYKNL